MSGIAGSELLLLCIIGLMILGPERLPRVARQLGKWAAKARQMTRSLQRQLEEEADLEKNLGFDPKQLKRDFEKELDPSTLMTPRDDDNYSPLHDEEDEHNDESVASQADESDKTDKNA